MTYATEFPNFADMPSDIPAGLIDRSWGNDACPSFTIWERETGFRYGQLVLWIDHANPEEREVATGKRFLVTLLAEDGRDEPIDLHKSDDCSQTRKAVEFLRDNIGDIQTLAKYFSALIRAEFTKEELETVNRRNRDPGYTDYMAGCATHDFRDSNAYIYGAYCALYFQEPDLNSEVDCQRINHAWTLAKETGFYPVAGLAE